MRSVNTQQSQLTDWLRPTRHDYLSRCWGHSTHADLCTW